MKLTMMEMYNKSRRLLSSMESGKPINYEKVSKLLLKQQIAIMEEIIKEQNKGKGKSAYGSPSIFEQIFGEKE